MSIYFHMDGMKWIYMAYQISLLLVSIINTNKYNFEKKDIPNPRHLFPICIPLVHSCLLCGTTHIVNVHLFPYGWNEMDIHGISD